MKEAKEILKEYKLNMNINNYDESLNFESTFVTEQIPKEGIKVKKDSNIEVYF